ncbi:UBP1-associated protein 2B-like [Iris pallida]|uniref:UBP1-associated protein 2B-like n=1 Tax=Iris pallida TaxID=29817 RepID=A0AAX6GXP1_IRIPA|nr:UBP1-associated protein 2B-like [Iris pallida]
MANLKKRKSDQEESNHLSDAKPPISYVRKDDSDSENDEDVAELLETLSKEQLVYLLRSAALSHPPTLAEIRLTDDADPSRRKIFVHGLGWDTTADSLRLHFSPFGDLDDVRVVTDKATGKSKGYGFILFRQRKCARKALKQPQKLIDNRMAACQLASLGPRQTLIPTQTLTLTLTPATRRILSRTHTHTHTRVRTRTITLRGRFTSGMLIPTSTGGGYLSSSGSLGRLRRGRSGLIG